MANSDNFSIQSFPEQNLSESERIKEIKTKKTHYVFLFGNSGSGKTSITASLLYYLATPECEYGDLESVGNLKGKNLNEYIRYLMLQEEKFPLRTDLQSQTTEVDCRFVPIKKHLNEFTFTLLEVSGEHLRAVDSVNSSGKLPDHIDIFLKVPDISLTFILVSRHDQCREDDHLMASFLNYLVSKSTHFRKAKILLLISQWDTSPYSDEKTFNLGEFIKVNMPQTYKKLNKNGNAYRTFSLGAIGERDGYPAIEKYDSKPAKKVFDWLYWSFTGKKIETWFDRLKNS